MAVKFGVLWANHPAMQGVTNPCTTNGKVNFENQCAIRLGVCLSLSGVNLGNFRGAKCYPGHGHKRAHILRAEELAGWLEGQDTTFGTPTKKKKVSGGDYKNKKGVIYLKDFWGPGNQGDHIDLWNGSMMTLGSPSYITASREVWFWEIA
jgi:Type VI secretion system (T6SS), amidase effector protein 4